MMGVIKLQLDPKLKSENTSLHCCLGAQAASLRLLPQAKPDPIGIVNKEHEAIGCKLCKTLQIWLCNCGCLLFSLLAQTIKENKKIERRNLTHEKIPQMEMETLSPWFMHGPHGTLLLLRDSLSGGCFRFISHFAVQNNCKVEARVMLPTKRRDSFAWGSGVWFLQKINYREGRIYNFIIVV